MKKILVLFVLLCGCASNHKFERLQELLYQQEEVYVQMNDEELFEKLTIQRKDYEKVIALKTLVVWQQKEIIIFYKPNESIETKFKSYRKEGYDLYTIDDYLIYMNEKNACKGLIEQLLNGK